MLVTASLLCVACATSPVGVVSQRDWIEIRTENFTLWSNLPSSETRAMARDLEIFRAAVLLISGAGDVSSVHPTWIYAFDGRTSFGPFNLESRALGYMMPTLRANILTTSGDDADIDSSTVLKHEYTHWLVRNESDRMRPKWFSEGFAEFMATVGEEDGMVKLGRVPEYRVSNLRYSAWVPLKEILDPDGYDHWPAEKQSMFYAQAWAFVNYWYTDHERREIFSAELGPYTEATQSGIPVAEAFEASFGSSVTRADRALHRYVRDGRFMVFGVPVTELDWSDGITERPLDDDEVAQHLGMLCYARDDQECARSLFEYALELNPANARATAGLADVEKSEEHFERAESLFDRALELDPDDALSLLDRGEFHTLRAVSTLDPDERRELLRSARRDFVRANEIAGPRPEIYAFYGATFLFDGENPEQGLETLEAAHALLPAEKSIRLMLADLYLRLDRRDDAIAMARLAFVDEHGVGLDEASQATLEAIASGERTSLPFFGDPERVDDGDGSSTAGQ